MKVDYEELQRSNYVRIERIVGDWSNSEVLSLGLSLACNAAGAIGGEKCAADVVAFIDALSVKYDLGLAERQVSS